MPGFGAFLLVYSVYFFGKNKVFRNTLKAFGARAFSVYLPLGTFRFGYI